MLEDAIQHIRKLQLVTLIGVILFLSVFSSHRALGQTQDQPLADTTFRPKTDGFAFQNYTNEKVVQNLTAVEMVKMFGNGVCADQATPCTLIPPAQQFMDEINKGMNDGHCEGMAALSLVLFEQKEKAADFGGNTMADLKFETPALQSEIARFFSTQATTPTRTGEVKGKTPNEIVDLLVGAMKDGAKSAELYTLGFYKREFKGGHAVTPYAVVDKGNDLVWIMIYDNNFPGEERYIEVDRKANTWKYSAAASPDIPESLYEGDADSKTMTITPTTPRLQLQDCSFCAAGGSANAGDFAAAAPKFNEISLVSQSAANNTNLLITDASGHKIGYEGGKFVNDFPGADFQPVTSDSNLWSDNPEPIYFIPQGVAFTVTLDGSEVKVKEPTDVVMLGAGYSLAVEGINLDPNQKDTITFSPDGTEIGYKSSNAESPNIVVGVVHTGADYEFDIKGAEVQAGDTIHTKLDFDKGQLLFSNTNTTAHSIFDLTVHKITDKGDHVLSKAGIDVAPGKGIFIDFGKISGTDIPTENQ